MEWVSSDEYTLLQFSLLTSHYSKENSSVTQPASQSLEQPPTSATLSTITVHDKLVFMSGSLYLYILLDPLSGTSSVIFCLSYHSGLCSNASFSDRPSSTTLSKRPHPALPVINWPPHPVSLSLSNPCYYYNSISYLVTCLSSVSPTGMELQEQCFHRCAPWTFFTLVKCLGKKGGRIKAEVERVKDEWIFHEGTDKRMDFPFLWFLLHQYLLSPIFKNIKSPTSQTQYTALFLSFSL